LVNRLPRLLFVTAILALSLVPAVALAQAEDVYSERTLEIARKLQCPICAGESVADSQTTLAAQMRDVIEQKVQAGESEGQILDYFVARYGEEVLSEPPKSGFHLTLWWLPVAVLLVGGLVVVLYLRERSGGNDTPTVADAADDAELEALAREALSSDTAARNA
jgi:cytochrome c-type biogenesis protein CcmH